MYDLHILDMDRNKWTEVNIIVLTETSKLYMAVHTLVHLTSLMMNK